MSTQPVPRKTGQKLNSATRGAIIAAVTSGLTQRDVAKRFSIHPNTVQNIIKEVKACDIEANPLANDWKYHVIRKARKAVDNLLELKQDPVAAGNAGLKVLYGTGELISGTQIAVKGDIKLEVSWLPAQQPGQAMITDAVPVDDDECKQAL